MHLQKVLRETNGDGEQAPELLMAQQFNERSAANMRKVAETQSMYMQFKAGQQQQQQQQTSAQDANSLAAQY